MSSQIIQMMLVLGLGAITAQACGDDRLTLLRGADARSWSQLLAMNPPEAIPSGAPPLAYGAKGSQWISVGSAIAFDLSKTTDFNGHVTITRFLAQDIEVGFEGALWGVSQEGSDAAGVSGSFLMRWHFYNEGDWTVFLDAGIGVLASTDNIPAQGTSLNFLPRVGIGFTHAIGRGSARLIAGAQYHHISNARLLGDDTNPARDLPLIYAGIVFPF